MLRLRLPLLLGALLATAGCSSNENCRDACDVLRSCTISTAGLSCAAACEAETDTACAACINDTAACGDVKGSCSSKCPNNKF